MALGRAVIEIHADTRPFRKGVEDGVKGAFKGAVPAIGQAATNSFTEGLKRFRFVPGTFQGILITGLSVAIAALAPAIATILQATFTAAVGLAGIGAAIALAISSSTELQQAGKALGQQMLLGLQQATQSLIPNIRRAMAELGDAFNDVIPQISEGFRSFGPSIEALAVGIGDFVRNIMPGLIQAFKNSGPAIEQLAVSLGDFGTTLGEVLRLLSEDGETNVEGIRLLFEALTFALYGTVFAIKTLSAAWQLYTSVLETVVGALKYVSTWGIYAEKILDKTHGTTGRLRKINQDNAGATRDMGNAFSSAAIQGQGLIETVRELYGIELNVTDAAIRVEEQMDRVTETFKENSNTLAINSEEGRENVSVVNQVIRAALAEHEAQIAAGAGVDQANAAYRRRIEELRKTLRQAGLTEKQINSLIGAYSEVPDGVSTKVTAPGLPGILSQAQALHRTLQAIHSQRIRVRMAADGTAPGGLAEGGVVTSPTLSWVGEAGAEAVVPLTNPARAQQVMAEAGLGGTTVVYLVVDGEIIDRKVARSNSNEARRVTLKPRMV